MDQLRRQLKQLALLMLLIGMPLGACRPAGAAGAAATGNEAGLAQFRSGLTRPDSLVGGAPSRDELVARFVRALERRDTAALVAMHLKVGEFAWFYYPTNPESRAPYNLAPDLMWFMLHGGSEKGLRRLLSDRAGFDLHGLGYRCDPLSSNQGDNTVNGPCLVRRVTPAGDTVEERLFGLIIERGGRYKFVSYSNKL